jgi:hypothetical protein
MAGLWIDIDVHTAGVQAALRRGARSTGPAVRAGVERGAKEAKSLFESSVTHYTSKPAFDIVTSGYGRSTTAKVGTDDEKYALVSRGAKAHYIAPRFASRLRFPISFRPKTAVGRLKSNSGGKYGSIIYRNIVWHPGFTGRKYDELVLAALNKSDVLRKSTLRELGAAYIRAGLRIFGFRR